MDDDDNLLRLEGSVDQKGGLIVKKKTPTFKVPQPSLLGLDKLAAAKRKEKEDNARKMSFATSEDDTNDELNSRNVGQAQQSRKFRQPNPETPTYTGGITEEARKRLLERMNSRKNKEKGVYASTKDLKYGKRDSDKKRHHHKDHSHRESQGTSGESNTPRFRDEPRTPNIKIKDVPSRTSWDDDDPIPIKKSSWDFPTPTLPKHGGDWSERSTKSKYDDYSHRKFDRKDKHKDYKCYTDTPRATPAYKYNAWAKDRKKTGATPGHFKEESNVKWESTVDRQLWEEEQRRIDREWYNMDEGRNI